MVGIMDMGENYIDSSIFEGVDFHDIGASHLFLKIRHGFAGKSFNDVFNAKLKRKKKKRKSRRRKKITNTKHVMAFLKKYSDVIENYERLTQILDQAENVLQGQKVAEGAEVRVKMRGTILVQQNRPTKNYDITHTKTYAVLYPPLSWLLSCLYAYIASNDFQSLKLVYNHSSLVSALSPAPLERTGYRPTLLLGYSSSTGSEHKLI